MTPERWVAVKDLFDRAVALPAEERRPLLEASGDPELALEVQQLIDQYEAAESFIETPPVLAQELRGLHSPEYSAGDVLAGRFELRRLLGRGGMGAVYEAVDREVAGERLALKTLPPSMVRDPRLMEGLVREVQSARRVTHPNVCRVYDFGKHGSGDFAVPFITMELLEGETLAARIARAGRIAESDAQPVLAQIAAALDAAHAAGVVHRDLKPANVILTAGGSRAVVTDFGLARVGVSAGPGSAVSQSSGAAGTLPYMAPEVLAGEAATPKSDLYALGVLMYEMATGRRPIEGANAVATIARQAAGEIEPPSARYAAISRRWETTILSCLARDPQRRPKSAAAAVQMLSRKSGTHTRLWYRRRVQWSAVAVAAGIIMSFAWWGFRYYQQTTILRPGVRVMLNGIRNLTGDERLNGMPVMLRSQVEQSPHIVLLGDAAVRGTLTAMHRPPGAVDDPAVAREVALRNGAPVTVFGNLSRPGQDYVLYMVAEQVADKPYYPNRSWSRSWTAARKEDLAAAVHDAGKWIRTVTGEAAGTLAAQDRPAAQTTTGSWEALQAYAAAENLAAAGSQDLAVAMLRDAIRIDPNFALAEMRAGDLLMSIRRQEEAATHYQRAIALANEGHLTRREELLLRGNYDGDTGDYAAAEAVLRSYVQEYPQEWRGSFLLANIYRMRGRLDEAVREFREAARKSPSSRAVYGNLATTYLIQGNYSGIEDAASHLDELGAHEYALYHRSNGKFVRGERQAALDAFLQLTHSADADIRGRSYSSAAQALAEMGQYRQAEELLRKGIDAEQAAGDGGRKVAKQLALAYLMYRRKQYREARGLCLNAIESDSSVTAVLKAATLLARAGFSADSEKLLKSISPAERQTPRGEAAALRIEGEIALANGNTASAIANFLHAARLEPPLYHRHYLARAYIRAGEAELAFPYYDQLLRSPGLFWHYADYDFPGLYTDTLFEAARAEWAYRPQQSLQYLTAFLALRHDADTNLDEVQSARAQVSKRSN